MIHHRFLSFLLFNIGLAVLQGCTAGRDPLQVTVAGFEPLQGEGMELRMMVKLRVQNPNEAPIEFKGVAVEMNVQGKSFASGVSDASGTVPGFGEAVVSVPVTISAMRILQQTLGIVNAGSVPSKLPYEMKGKLNGASAFGSVRFSTKGEFEFPTATPSPPA